MKIKYLFILASLVGAVTAPLFIMGPNGKPLMSLNDWIPKDSLKMLDKVKSATNTNHEEVSGAGKQIFYKWKDADGVWQLTQFKPDHIDASDIQERVIYANANIIQSLDSNSISQALAKTENQKKFVYNPPKNTSVDVDGLDKSEKDDFSLSTVSVDQIPKLIQEAKNVGPALKNRQDAVDKIIRQ